MKVLCHWATKERRTPPRLSSPLPNSVSLVRKLSQDYLHLQAPNASANTTFKVGTDKNLSDVPYFNMTACQLRNLLNVDFAQTKISKVLESCTHVSSSAALGKKLCHMRTTILTSCSWHAAALNPFATPKRSLRPTSIPAAAGTQLRSIRLPHQNAHSVQHPYQLQLACSCAQSILRSKALTQYQTHRNLARFLNRLKLLYAG